MYDFLSNFELNVILIGHSSKALYIIMPVSVRNLYSDLPFFSSLRELIFFLHSMSVVGFNFQENRTLLFHGLMFTTDKNWNDYNMSIDKSAAS